MYLVYMECNHRFEQQQNVTIVMFQEKLISIGNIEIYVSYIAIINIKHTGGNKNIGHPFTIFLNEEEEKNNGSTFFICRCFKVCMEVPGFMTG